MKISLSEIPQWVRRDGSVSVQMVVDYMEQDAQDRGHRLTCTKTGTAIVEIPLDDSIPVPSPWVSEDYIKDFLLRGLLNASIPKTHKLYDQVLKNTKKIRYQMKQTLPQQDISEKQTVDWIISDPTGIITKNDVWELALEYGWNKESKKAFFQLFFPDNPNGVIVRIGDKVTRGWKGGSFTKSAEFKLKLLKHNKKAIK